MSHELRTPLNSVLGFSRLLAEHGNLTEGQQVRVKVLEADDKGRLRLSMKSLTTEEKAANAGN